MKPILTYPKRITALLLIAGMVSCKDSFLEVVPKGRLVAETVSDYNLLMSNLDLVNIESSAQVALGDELVAIEPYFSGSDLKTQRLFRYEDVVYEPDEDAAELSLPLQNIYLYNKVIHEVAMATEGTDQQKQSLEAEARAGRAWTYFLLINYFGKPYQESSAATDPGFPIVAEADVTTTQFNRASVKEVYDFIVDDLTKAIPLLPAQTTHRLRMSKPAAEGLLAKVYVFMGKFEEALPLLDAALAEISTATIAVGLYDYNKTLAAGGEFLPIDLFGPAYPTVVNNEENVYGKQATNYPTFTDNEFVISPKTAALYDPADLRLTFYSTSAFFGPTYPGGFLRKIGPVSIQFGVVVPDLYLLRAECRARANHLEEAKADVETLRKNRMPTAKAPVPASIASQKRSMIQYIMDERIREFALAGYRWFDMRRLSVDPLFSNSAYVHTLYGETGQVTSTYMLKPDRLVLRFPQKIMNENPGMENNP